MSAKAMTAIGVFFVLLGAAALSAIPTGAPKAQGAGDRYLVTQIEGGIVRVDQHTGEVSVCKDRGGKWSCNLVPDDRAALKRKIDDMERGQAKQRRSADRRATTRNQQDERRRAKRRRHDEEYDDLSDGDDGGFMSPEEVDNAMNSVDRMMDRFMETARKIRRRMVEGDKTQN